MKNNYSITGMHCQSCVKKLTDALSLVDGVESVEVTLVPPRADVTGSKFRTSEITKAVASAGDYSVTATSSAESASTATRKSMLVIYYPLILIVTFLVAGCAILQFRNDSWDWMVYMADFMGGFFVVLGFFARVREPTEVQIDRKTQNVADLKSFR